jgi:hypothetical protein
LLELGVGALLARNLAAQESQFDTISTSVAFAGALDYAAPEWVADPTRPTPAADQYALGAVGFFALTGRPPPAHEPRMVAEWNPAVPSELAAVIDKLLQLDPAGRFTGMDEVRAVLAEICGLVPQPDHSPDPPDSRSATGPSHAGKQAGIIAWNSAVQQRLAHDEHEASVGFDLPDVPEPPGFDPAAGSAFPASATPTRSPAADSTPTDEVALTDTLHPATDTPSLPPPWTPAPPHPTTREGPNRLVPLDEDEYEHEYDDLPPLLPAIPLLPVLPTGPDSSASASARTVQAESRSVPAEDEPAPTESVLWKSMKKKFLFWQTPTDFIQVGVFGPLAVAHSQAPRLTVFLYPPSAAESVGTLARAFQHEAVLLGTGSLAVEVVRGARLAVHLGVSHVAVSRPLTTFVWRGNPHRLAFDLTIPWEAPVGAAPGMISVGKDDVRVGKIEFQLPILDGTG